MCIRDSHMPYKGYPAITPGNDKVLGEIMVINEEEYDETVKDMDCLLYTSQVFQVLQYLLNLHHKKLCSVKLLYCNCRNNLIEVFIFANVFR